MEGEREADVSLLVGFLVPVMSKQSASATFPGDNGQIDCGTEVSPVLPMKISGHNPSWQATL